MLTQDEVKDALVFWLTRSTKNNSATCQLAAYMNNSVCVIHMPKNKEMSITFTWDEDDEQETQGW
tara:strand:- start:200 stop:394 length:195 start_codon:yes stop_codon:yes gene_type:complete